MRRDSIFFRLFQQFPALLFELLEQPPDDASRYRFDSVGVKETKFEIDGVFLPPAGKPGTVYFCEVQFQLDQQLYERLWSESSRYFFQNRQQFSDWEAVVIYPSRKREQKDLHPHRSLLSGGQVHRVYLNELGDAETLPLGLALMVLTTSTPQRMPQTARTLLARSAQEVPNPIESHAIIDMISTIVVYKFTHLSRQEVDAMLGVRVQETRVYQEAREEGREEEARSLILRQLSRRMGALPEQSRLRIEALALPQLENLSVALIDFATIGDLETWFDTNP
jgi:predicted transposase/invertase (TIGR01784 family)